MRRILLTILAVTTVLFSMNANELPLPGVYKIKNVYSGTYVKLQSTYLADITADEDDASPIYTWYTLESDGEGLLSELSGDGGDMIETLSFIKGLIEEVLEYNNKPTWFLDEMFHLHLVSTGDADGSVYLCVDVPAIDDWEEIRDIILEAAAGQPAVTYYISHMQPGNRHYMGIDYDGSFGYRLEAGTLEGTDIKWMMENSVIDDIDGFAFIKGALGGSKPYLTLNESGTPRLGAGANEKTVNPGAVYRLATNDNLVSAMRTQGVDVAAAANDFAQALSAQLGDGAPRCRFAMCPTYSAADKFAYPNYYMRLELPVVDTEQWSTALAAALNALAQTLGDDSHIAQSFNDNADMLVPGAAIYFVPDGNTVGIVGEADRANYADAAKWVVEPIDNQQVFFAANPADECNGKFYTTLYTDFAYEIANPDLVKALIVPTLNKKGEATSEQLAELGATTVPARTAVVLECTSQNNDDNMLIPVDSETAAGAPALLRGGDANLLQGTFFNNQQTVETNTRTLQVVDGQLTFAPTSLQTLPGNTAWLTARPVPTAIDDIKDTTEMQDGAIYDLTGRRVLNPTHGIYIQNGKKIIR